MDAANRVDWDPRLPAFSRARRLELIALLGALTAFAPLSIDMYLPALPTIARQFHASIGAAELTLASFFTGFTFGQVLFGPLTDRFGRKGPLYAGTLLYIVASLGCALSGGVAVLAALRFLQALGACAGMVIARASARDIFGPHEAPRIYAYMMLILGLAPLLAPFIGGYVLVWFGWRAIFLLQASIGVAALVATFFRIPESLAGARRELHPLKVLRDYAALLVDRRFIGYVLAGAVSNAGLFAYITAAPHVFIDLFHVAPQHFGWFFGANAIGLVTGAQVGARLLKDRSATHVLLAAQIVQWIAGLVLLTCALTGFGGMWGIAGGLFLFVALNGAIMPIAAGCAMHHFGRMAGMASALLGALQFGAAAIVSTAIGNTSPDSAIPMAAVIAGCGIAGLAFNLLLRPKIAAG
ncbi:MAG TPA: Bcr/CflA family multidrug efflux MFS transporter [Rhizomicrobium sp.]